MRSRDILRFCVFGLVALLSAARDRRLLQSARDFRAVRDGAGADAVRSADGRPGPQYWQNRADYRIRATLDPATHAITGTVEIRYTNNSPDTLDVLWLQLEQNLYRRIRAAAAAEGSAAPRGFTEGMSSTRSTGAAARQAVAVQPLISDTRAQIRLPAPLAHGATAVLRISYHYTVPEGAVGRPHRLDGSAERRRSTRSPNGIRAWPSMTTFAAGTRCPTSRRNSISNMATSIIR